MIIPKMQAEASSQISSNKISNQPLNARAISIPKNMKAIR